MTENGWGYRVDNPERIFRELLALWLGPDQVAVDAVMGTDQSWLYGDEPGVLEDGDHRLPRGGSWLLVVRD